MTVFSNKKYYGYYSRNKKDVLHIVVTLFIGVLFFFFLKLFFDVKRDKDIYVGMICLVSSVYYLFLDKKINDVKKTHIHCGSYSNKCIKGFHANVVCLFVFSIIFFILSIIMNLNMFLYIVLIIYTLLIGLGLMNFSLIVFFGDDYYYSSGFKVYYDEIDKIVQEGQVNTINGIMMLCKLEKNGEIIGYEKLMLADYIYLNDVIGKEI